MKALSIRQPWAWLIIQGYKDVENRKWQTNYRGKLYVHASKIIDMKAYNIFRDFYDLPDLETLQRGGIIGQVEIVDCVKSHQSDWFEGPFGFVLKNSKPLPFKPCRGKLGFFDVAYQKPSRPKRLRHTTSWH